MYLGSRSTARRRAQPSLVGILIAMLAVLSIASSSRASQATFELSAGGKERIHDAEAHPLVSDAPPQPAIPDLIDVLSQSDNHTILMRLFQRARLIPTLIMLQELGDGRGLTIFAPTDEAIMGKAKSERAERTRSSVGPFSLEASYVDWDIAPRTPWEWALYLASSEYEHEHGMDSEDEVMPVWYADTTRLDNINAVLRQQLLYHMVNYTLPYSFDEDGSISVATDKDAASLPEEGRAAMLATLHMPSRRLLHEPTRPGPVPQPPGNQPQPGVEDDGGLLGGEGQKVRIARGDKKGKVVKLGTNSRGEGGVSIVAANTTSPKGILLSIDGILDLPPSFDTVMRTHPDLQYLLNLTSSRAMHSLSESAHATFLLPRSESFDALSTIEQTYLSGSWSLAEQDRLKLFGEHISGIGVGRGTVAYADRLRDLGTYNLTTIFGGDILVNATSTDSMTVGKATIVQEDILIENGVIHIVDKLLLPNDDLGLSVEKTLLALNASKWVSLMHQEGLSSYIDASPNGNDEPDDKIEPWTFLVPRNEEIQMWLDEHGQAPMHFNKKWGVAAGFEYPDEGDKEPTRGSSLEDVLLYHIAPRARAPQNLTDGMLIGTELRGWKLKDARQRLLVGVDDSDSARGDRQGNGDVGFGDASVIASPVKVGPSIIYLISKLLDPPDNPIQTAVSSLSLSTFVATVFSAELDKPIKRAPAITYLVPHNDAFTALGLAMPYLLLDQKTPRQELRSVIEYHAIDRIVYTKDFASSPKRYPTIEGSDIWAVKGDNGTIELRRGKEGRARVIRGDLLTSTGVLHELDRVELPPTLDLTIEKLMRGAKAETMRDLVNQAGYGWILNGTTPTDEQMQMLPSSKFPDSDKRKRDRKRHKNRHKLLRDRDQSYTVLCPTDNAFTRINLTYYYENPEALRQLVQMHIIPSPANQTPLPDVGTAKQLPIGIRDEVNFATLLDATVGGASKYGKIAFRKVAPAPAPDAFGNYRGSVAPSDEDPGLGWIVGVADTRGTDGRKVSARVLSFGRESLAIESENDDKKDNDHEMYISKKRRNKRNGESAAPLSQSIGGILTIDAVLHPYEPGWFYRWGWIVLVSTIVVGVLAAGGYGLWQWWHRDGRIRLSEALDGEEE